MSGSFYCQRAELSCAKHCCQIGRIGCAIWLETQNAHWSHLIYLGCQKIKYQRSKLFSQLRICVNTFWIKQHCITILFKNQNRTQIIIGNRGNQANSQASNDKTATSGSGGRIRRRSAPPVTLEGIVSIPILKILK
jgi:hypothetical protein